MNIYVGRMIGRLKFLNETVYLHNMRLFFLPFFTFFLFFFPFWRKEEVKNETITGVWVENTIPVKCFSRWCVFPGIDFGPCHDFRILRG